MKLPAWASSYTARALAATALMDVGIACGVAAGGGEVAWWQVAFGIGNKVAVLAARFLLGEPVTHTPPPPVP